jgi:hypothetical protein
MPGAKTFTIAGYRIDIIASTIYFDYEVELQDDLRRSFVDTIILPSVSKGQWDAVPANLLRAICEMLCLSIGTKYWKVGCAPEIRIRQFVLSRQQAEFWNESYTKGLGEFFYRANIDFRGLVSFPYSEEYVPGDPLSFPRRQRALLAQGGGKDSAVSAELLIERKVQFDTFSISPNKAQKKVAEMIGRPTVEVRQIPDPKYRAMRDAKELAYGFPSVSIHTCIAILTAALLDYRYVIFSNEQSADVGNLHYLGLDVNHQWSKSSEAEILLRKYLKEYVTEDIVPFSLIREYSELEMVRRFSKHEKYFYAFSSCNMNPSKGSAARSEVRPGRSYWCNECPKCVFIFTSLTAFLPLRVVEDIFGENLYAKPELLPTFRRLLGIQSFKPFECVGIPSEMIVAMSRARGQGVQEDLPAMKMFEEYLKAHPIDLKDLESDVFSSHVVTAPSPEDFTALYPLQKD